MKRTDEIKVTYQTDADGTVIIEFITADGEVQGKAALDVAEWLRLCQRAIAHRAGGRI